jgi:hypothetical protein
MYVVFARARLEAPRSLTGNLLEVTMQPLIVALIVLALLLVLGSTIMDVKAGALGLPKMAAARRVSPDEFCRSQCRKAGECPLTGTHEPSADCPMWNYLAVGGSEPADFDLWATRLP